MIGEDSGNYTGQNEASQYYYSQDEEEIDEDLWNVDRRIMSVRSNTELELNSNGTWFEPHSSGALHEMPHT